MRKAFKLSQLFGFSRSASQFLFLLGFLSSPGSLGQMAALPIWNQCKEAGKVIKVFKDPTLIEGFSLPAGCQQFRFKIWGSGGGGGAGALRNTSLVDGGYGGAGAYVELRINLQTSGAETINVKLGDGGGGGAAISATDSGKIVGNGGGGGGATFVDLLNSSGTTNIATIGGAGGGGGAAVSPNYGGIGAPTKIAAVSHGDAGFGNHTDTYGRGASVSGVGAAAGPDQISTSAGNGKNGGRGGSPPTTPTGGVSAGQGSAVTNSGAGGSGGAASNHETDNSFTFAGGGGGGGGLYGAGGGRSAYSGGVGGSGGGAASSSLASVSWLTLIESCNSAGATPWTACKSLPGGVPNLPANVASGGTKGIGKIRNGVFGTMSNNPGGKGGQGLVLLYVDR